MPEFPARRRRRRRAGSAYPLLMYAPVLPSRRFFEFDAHLEMGAITLAPHAMIPVDPTTELDIVLPRSKRVSI